MKNLSKSEEGISVILPVYNGAIFLRQSINSILEQTFNRYELIIIDDGSTDESWQIISEYLDHPSISAKCQSNKGLAATLNVGISCAKFDYIARQDQDDISKPDRLEKQFNFLKSHPQIDLVGSSALIIDEKNIVKKRKLSHPLVDPEIKLFLLFDTPFVHSSVLFKKSSVVKSGLYSTDLRLQPPEDYELWTRMAAQCSFANLAEPLLYYREVNTSMSRATTNPFIKNLITASSLYIHNLSEQDINTISINKLFHFYQLENTNIHLGELIFAYIRLWRNIYKKRFNPFEKMARYHLKIIIKNFIKYKASRYNFTNLKMR